MSLFNTGDVSRLDRPKLILTPDRIEELKVMSKTSHKQLFELALQSADAFAAKAVPQFQNAHNAHRDIGDTMPVLGLAYLMTGEEVYLSAAEKWLQALLAVPSWKGSSNLGRSSWTVGCALLYDWLYDDLQEEMRFQIKERLLSEVPIIMETASFTRALSNHLLIETSAVGLTGLALRGERKEAECFLEQADEWANYIIDYAPTDGSWGEGIQYWAYGTGYFLRFIAAAKTTGYKDYYPQYNWLKETGWFPIYFSLPERPTEVINFGDCGSERYLPPFLLYQAAGVAQNGYFQNFGNCLLSGEPHKFSWLDLLSYDSAIATQDIHSLPTLRHFDDHGFVTMRSGWDADATAIGFRCGPAPGHRNQKDPGRVDNRGFGPGHQHPDINSFNIYSRGQWLAIDPGYTHVKETRNHNTIIANGYGQAGAGGKWLDYMAFEAREPAPRILKVESNSVYDYVLGDAGNVYVDEARLKHFRRHLLFLKSDIIVVADDLYGDEDSHFEWLLNGREEIAECGAGQFEIVSNGVRLWIQPLLPQSFTHEIQERSIKASDLKSQPDSEMGLLHTLNLQTTGDRARYLVVMSVLNDSGSATPVLSFDGQHLDVTLNNTSWHVQYVQCPKTADEPMLVVEKRIDK
ncbi:MAG: heparinase II/III family protein [Candidatus Latescibacteria bacterium]|jgi:hypothetical protein|nr:heparinase II/III family protein [Candidatus Latescibacterota bacterium]